MKATYSLFVIIILMAVFPTKGKSQVPTIASFAPKSGPIGTSVTLTGNNFSDTPANNIVYFGATRAEVTAATPVELTVDVPSGASYQLITVTVGGLTAYSSAPFVVTFSSNSIIDESSFANKVDLSTSLAPSIVAISDFDGDGKIDLTAPCSSGSVVSVIGNNCTPREIASEKFTSNFDLVHGYSPSGLAVGDLDGDGKQDIASIYNGTTVSVFKNVSTGAIDDQSFNEKVDFLVGFSIALTHIAVGDLDLDGKPDLVVTEQIGNKVYVFKNTSATGIINAQSFDTPVLFKTGVLPMGIAVSDLDGDGKPEIVVANVNGNTVSVLKNKSVVGTIDANSFASKVDFASGPNGSMTVAIGDIDGDEKPDIAVANYYSSTVSILKNTTTVGVIGANSFATKVDFSTETGPQSISMGDLNGDGKVDLAIANFSANVTDASANTVSVLRNTSTQGTITTSSFASKVNFKAGLNPISVMLGDFDGDNKLDLAVANYNGNSISILRNKDSQTITSFDLLTDKNMGDPPFELRATSSTGFDVVFTADSYQVMISNTTATIVAPGRVTINAEQPGDNFFSAAPKVSQTICIIPEKPTIKVDTDNEVQTILSSSSDFGNQWYQNDHLISGATGKSYWVKSSGLYKVKVVVDGCIGPFSDEQNLIITGNASEDPLTEVQLYPNPAHDQFFIQLSGFKENQDVNIMIADCFGKTIFKHIGKGGEKVNVELSDYINGVYFIIMTQGKKTLSQKIIKH